MVVALVGVLVGVDGVRVRWWWCVFECLSECLSVCVCVGAGDFETDKEKPAIRSSAIMVVLPHLGMRLYRIRGLAASRRPIFGHASRVKVLAVLCSTTVQNSMMARVGGSADSAGPARRIAIVAWLLRRICRVRSAWDDLHSPAAG